MDVNRTTSAHSLSRADRFRPIRPRPARVGDCRDNVHANGIEATPAEPMMPADAAQTTGGAATRPREMFLAHETQHSKRVIDAQRSLVEKLAREETRAPAAARQPNAYKQRFWCHDRPRSEKWGGWICERHFP
eukprot:scaffold31783_cov95-Phaeocystis_antarctica.AAC.2